MQNVTNNREVILRALEQIDMETAAQSETGTHKVRVSPAIVTVHIKPAARRARQIAHNTVQSARTHTHAARVHTEHVTHAAAEKAHKASETAHKVTAASNVAGMMAANNMFMAYAELAEWCEGHGLDLNEQVVFWCEFIEKSKMYRLLPIIGRFAL